MKDKKIRCERREDIQVRQKHWLTLLIYRTYLLDVVSCHSGVQTHVLKMIFSNKSLKTTMKKNTYPAFYRLPARYTFALLAMAGSASVAMADGKISMDAFSLAPGQTVTVAVNLEQTGDIYGLQANVALPNGLKLVDAKADEMRVEDKVHTFQYKQNGDGYIFLITPDKSRAIYGNSGMLFELTLEADGSFAGGDIQFSNVVLSNTSAEKTVQDDFSVSVALTQFTVGDFSVAADLLTITENGGPYMVEVLLDNKIPVKGLQGTISLPDGLSIKKDSKGYPIFINGERLTESASLDYNEENGRFVLVDQKTPDFWGYGGVLFSFEVVPDESKLAKTSEIVLGSFTISTANNASVDFDQRLVVTVDNSAYFKAGFEQFLSDINAVRQDCQDAMNAIQTNYNEEVAAKYVPQLENLLAQLDMEAERIQQEQEAGKSPSEVELNLEPYTEGITLILADARTAQSDIIYAAYETKIAELQQSHADTKSYIDTYLPDVAAQFAAQLEGIAQNIESFSNTMATAKAAGKPAMELQFGMEEFTAVDEQLSALLDEAKAAQSAYLYAEFDKALAQLATDLADTKAALENYPDVKDSFAGRIAAVETALAEVKGFIEESKAAGTLAMELTSAKEALQAMDAELASILAEAKAAQSAYLYAEFDKALAQLATDLADTKEALNNYPDVKDNFAERMAAVEAALAEVKAFIEESKAAGADASDLTSAKEALQAMDAELASILAEAKAAQSDFAYAEFDKALTQLATALADTKETLDNCPDVKDKFAERMAAVEAALAEVQAFIEESKAAGADATDLTSAKEAIQAMETELAAIQAEAKAAQNDFAYAEFDKALAQIATALADTKETLDNCPDVKGLFAERMAAVEAALAEVQAFIEESKAAGADATDLTSAKEALQAMEAELAAIQAEAKAAQEEYTALYADYTAQVDEVQAALEEAVRYIENECADVADNYKDRAEEIQAMIDAVKADVEAAKTSGNLFDFVFSVADIKVAIDEMLQAAIDEQQTVGIGLIELDGEQPVRIYSTSGVQSDKVIKGKVNIVRMPDGTVKKIFVK